MSDIDALLAERERTHGHAPDVAAVYIAITSALSCGTVSHTHSMAIDMIAMKLARIVCGDPTYADHWRDIAGYAELGARHCASE